MSGQLRGVHVFAILAVFFMVMFAVNGVFIWRAVTTFPGEEVEKSYLQGLDYNATLEQRAAQSELGWDVEIGVDPSNAERLFVRVVDRAGSPVGNLDLNVRQRRYGGAGESAYALKSVEPGAYAATMPPMDGRAQIILEARRRGEEAVVFTAHKTLTLS